MVNAGIQHIRDGLEPQSALSQNMSVIGIIGTAPNRNAATIPLNEPLQINTNSPLRADLGGDGTIEDALAGISVQLQGGITAAQCIVVVVEDDVDPLVVINNIVGDEADGTGVYAFLGAAAEHAITPRVLIAPGFTSQRIGGAANAVCTEMPTICERLQGIFIPEGPTTSRTDWIDWRNTLPAVSTIVHPLRQDGLEQVGTALVAKPLSPYIAVQYAIVDEERDGVPSGSVANRPIFGLEDVTPRIPFNFTDGSTEGQQDLDVNAGIVARGQSGVSGSISNSGLVFWGIDTLDLNGDFQFAHVVRLRNYMELFQVEVLRIFLGRRNINVQTIQEILNTLQAQIDELVADNHILGGQVGFTPDQNLPTELRLGELDVVFRAEEPPVLRRLIIRSRRFEPALDELVQTISTQLSNITN